MDQTVNSYLFTQGVLGVACLVLGYVVMKLYGQVGELNKTIVQLMESRRLDQKEQTDKLLPAIQGMSDGVRMLTEKIMLGKERRL